MEEKSNRKKTIKIPTIRRSLPCAGVVTAPFVWILMCGCQLCAGHEVVVRQPSAQLHLAYRAGGIVVDIKWGRGHDAATRRIYILVPALRLARVCIVRAVRRLQARGVAVAATLRRQLLPHLLLDAHFVLVARRHLYLIAALKAGVVMDVHVEANFRHTIDILADVYVHEQPETALVPGPGRRYPSLGVEDVALAAAAGVLCEDLILMVPQTLTLPPPTVETLVHNVLPLEAFIINIAIRQAPNLPDTPILPIETLNLLQPRPHLPEDGVRVQERFLDTVHVADGDCGELEHVVRRFYARYEGLSGTLEVAVHEDTDVVDGVERGGEPCRQVECPPARFYDAEKTAFFDVFTS